MSLNLTKSQSQFLGRVASDLAASGNTEPTVEEMADAMVARLNREAKLMNDPRVIDMLLKRVWNALNEK